jgi:hypothetical protein
LSLCASADTEPVDSRATGYVLSPLRRIIGAAQCQLIEFADSIPARA